MKGRPSLSPGTTDRTTGSGHTQHIPHYYRISLGWLGWEVGGGGQQICLMFSLEEAHSYSDDKTLPREGGTFSY